MRILIWRDDFSADCCELRAGDAALEFAGKNDKYFLPYSAVKDFSITQDRGDKTYFTMLSDRGVLDGQITDVQDVELFVSALKEKLHGVIQIEIRKN